MADLPGVLKGRGAVGNPPGRFETEERAREDDGQESASSADTVVVRQRASSIISRNDSPDIPFSQSVNPYQGCEHGCVYCYARPSHAYLGLSPGLDFESRLFAKENAAELLRQALSSPGYRCEVISLGANTDPYQPVERQLGITREILKVLLEFRHPVGIVTKGSLIERDMDLLEPMARMGLVRVFISIATLDRDVARSLEPRAAAPWRRLEVIRKLAAGGIPCGVFVAPVIPFVTDAGMDEVLESAGKMGAESAAYVVLRLPFELKKVFRDWLDLHFPERAAHVMARIREMRGGKDNDSTFGARMRGEGILADLIRQRFDLACRKHGLGQGFGFELDTTRFLRAGGSQLSLFS